MTFSEHRNRIGKVIIFANFAIFLLVFILFFLNGFTPEELTEILKYLIPIKSVYMTTLVRYIIVHKDESSTGEQIDQQTTINPLYRNLSQLLVYTHISSLSLVILFCALNLISFQALTLFVAIIETFFGAYVGLVISDMYKVE